MPSLPRGAVKGFHEGGAMKEGLCEGVAMMEPPPPRSFNKWVVCILLECILVLFCNLNKKFANAKKWHKVIDFIDTQLSCIIHTKRLQL